MPRTLSPNLYLHNIFKLKLPYKQFAEGTVVGTKNGAKWYVRKVEPAARYKKGRFGVTVQRADWEQFEVPIDEFESFIRFVLDNGTFLV